MQAGAVVVCHAGSHAPVLTRVTPEPTQDGTVLLECGWRVRPEHLRSADGQAVEYFSSSLQQWIAGRVLRSGRLPGTVDLDCKEGAELARVRLGQPARKAVPTGDLPDTLPQMSSGSSSRPQEPLGPLGLEPGECCFYRSYQSGWIPAQNLRFRQEDATYDLSVKQQARVESICCIRPGDKVEYQSTSSNQWIVAVVLRRGGNPETFDLDCKQGVHFGRLRPPCQQPPRPLEPAPEPPACATAGRFCGAPTGLQQHPPPGVVQREPPAFYRAPLDSRQAPMGSAKMVPAPPADCSPTAVGSRAHASPQGKHDGAAPPLSAFRLDMEAASPQFGHQGEVVSTEPFLAGQRMPGESPPQSCVLADREAEAALGLELQEALRCGDPQALQHAIERATAQGMTGPEISQAMAMLRAMGGKLQRRPKSVQFLEDPVQHPPDHAQAAALQSHEEDEDDDEPGFLTRLFGAKPTEDSSLLTRMLGPAPAEDSGLYTRVLGPGPTKGAGLVTRVLGPKPQEGAGLLTRLLGPEHAFSGSSSSPFAEIPDAWAAAAGAWEDQQLQPAASIGTDPQLQDFRRQPAGSSCALGTDPQLQHVDAFASSQQLRSAPTPGTNPQLHPGLSAPGTDPQLHPVAPSTNPQLHSAAALSTYPQLHSSAALSTNPQLHPVAAPGTDPQLQPAAVPGTSLQLHDHRQSVEEVARRPLQDQTVQELSDMRREMQRLRAEAARAERCAAPSPTEQLWASAPPTDPKLQEVPETAPKLYA